ncbi:MAG: PAS domain-containing protein [Bacteroidales bacterium]|nr:PAS domain-containing protein [Candidatus Latescibacterota bacterium]
MKEQHMDELMRRSWKAAAETAETPLILIDSRGTVLDVNVAFCKMSGFTAEDLEGTIPPYPFSIPGGIDEALKGLNGQEESVSKATIRGVSGVVLPVRVLSTRLIGSDSGLISSCLRPDGGSVKSGNNVLALDTGALLDAMMECVEDGFFIKDRDRIYAYVSDNFSAMLRIAPNRIIGRKYGELFEDDRVETVKGNDLAVLEGQTVQSRYNRVIAERACILNVKKTPLRDSTGEVIGIVGITRDVTAETRLAIDLIHAQRTEALMNLASDIAHDFNNFIYGITGYVALAMSSLDEEHPAFVDLKEAINATEQAGEYTKKLQALGRYMPPDLGEESVGDILGSLEHVLQSTFPDDITIDLNIRSEDIRFVVDRGRIERALLNICLNARDAMPDGGTVMIESGIVNLLAADLETGLDIPDGPYCRIVISDSGEGMDPETREHAFEPFFTTRKIASATGLGLSIAFGIIKDHKGTIKIITEPGQGTAVEVLLPLTEEQAALQSEESSAESLHLREVT